MFKKAISLILSVSLILTQPVFAQDAGQLDIGKYLNQMPAVKPDSFRPAHLRYVAYDIKADSFQLLLDKGESPKLQDATQELFNYFLIGLSLPNDKFWVNLRPDAPEQIIDPELEKTDMGKIMLEADLQLKKDTSSLTSPQNPEGKEYWDKLYKRAGELFGTENITIPTITRPWIVPGEVIIRESEDSAYIYKANLKVMLEEDYISSQPSAVSFQQYTFSDPRMKELNKYSTELIKELILPRLTQEINTSKKYAQLRQVFFSLILSRWFKDKYQGYSVGNGLEPFPTIDSGDLTNLASKEPWSKDYYFNQYKKSFQQGEYNLKEQITTPTGQVIRSYVSGGIQPLEGISFISQQPNSITGTYVSDNRGFLDLSFLLKVKDAIVYVGNKFGLKKNFYPKEEDYKQESPHDGYGVTGSVDTNHSDSGSSSLSSEEIGQLLEEHFKVNNQPDTRASAASSIEASQEIIDKIWDIASRIKSHFGWYYYSDSVHGDLYSYLGPRTRSYDRWISALDKIKNFLAIMPKGNDEEFITSILIECNDVLDRISVLSGKHFYDDRLKPYFSADLTLKKRKNQLEDIRAQVNKDESEFYKWFPFNKQALMRIIENYDDESGPAFIHSLKEAIEENKKRGFEENMRNYYAKYNSIKEIEKDIEGYKIHSVALGLMYYYNKYEIKNIGASLNAIKGYFENREDIATQQEDRVVLKPSNSLPKKIRYALFQAIKKVKVKIPGWKNWSLGNILEFQQKLEQSVSPRKTIDDITDKRISQLLHIFLRGMVRHKKFADYFKHLSREDLKRYLVEGGASDAIPIDGAAFNRIMDMIPYDFEIALETEIINVLSGEGAALPEFLGTIWQLYCHTLVGKFINEYKRNENTGRNVLIIMAREFFDYDTDSQIFKEVAGALRDNKVKEYLVNNISIGVHGVSDMEEHLAMAYEQYLDQGNRVSSALTQDSPQNTDLPLMPGGIDFTQINYLTRPMGSFQGLDLRLPLLSKVELEGMDINRELVALEQMINAKIEVSTDRLKRLLAAMSQKDAFTSQRETQLLPLLLRLCWLKEERGVETTSDFRAVLLIADTGLFVEQGNTKYSLN